VEVGEGWVRLSYGFPVALFRAELRDVVEVSDVNSLARGKLFKYFKFQVVPLALMPVIPVVYVAAKSSLPPLVYLPYLGIPVALGVLLSSYFLLTTTSFKKFIEKVCFLFCVGVPVLNFWLGITYRETYGRSLARDYYAAGVLILGEMLIFILLVAVWIYSTRRHIIVLEDSDGRYYAVVARDGDAAREFLNLVVDRVMRSA